MVEKYMPFGVITEREGYLDISLGEDPREDTVYLKWRMMQQDKGKWRQGRGIWTAWPQILFGRLVEDVEEFSRAGEEGATLVIARQRWLRGWKHSGMERRDETDTQGNIRANRLRELQETPSTAL